MFALPRPLPARPARILATALAAIVAVAPPAASALAQEAEPETASLISLDFAGGTAIDYVEAVRKASADLNVVTSPEAAEVRIPALTLRRVTRQAALDLLSGRQVRSSRHAVELTVRHMPVYATGEEPTFQIVAEVHGTEPHATSRVWTIRNLVDGGLTSEAILSALEMALEMVGDGLQIRFHADTALLIARGDEDGLAMVDQVVVRLRQSLSDSTEGQLTRTRARVTELEQILLAKEAELSALRMQLQQSGDQRPGNPR